MWSPNVATVYDAACKIPVSERSKASKVAPGVSIVRSSRLDPFMTPYLGDEYLDMGDVAVIPTAALFQGF